MVTPVAAAAGGDAMACGPYMMLEVVNGGGGSCTVTINVPASRTWEPNVAITSPAVAVANGVTKWIGPIDASTFMDPTTGLASITYSTVASVTVAAVQLSQP